jgi:hypothetical protein
MTMGRRRLLSLGVSVLLLAGCRGNAQSAAPSLANPGQTRNATAPSTRGNAGFDTVTSPPSGPSSNPIDLSISPSINPGSPNMNPSNPSLSASGGPQEGPAILWDAPLSQSVRISASKLAKWPGLAFTPVLPRFETAPDVIYLSTDPNQGAKGGLIALHYSSPQLLTRAVDGRVVVTEQAAALALNGLAGLATGSVPASVGRPVRVAGHLSLVSEFDGFFSLVTVRGKALITVAGPAITYTEVIALASAL